MKKIFVSAIYCLIAAGTYAQPKTERLAVNKLCGCFEVDFKYAETFAASEDYKFQPGYHASGLEWVVAEETTDKKITLQHLLAVSDTMIIKHWREDWEFEKNDWWQFTHDGQWKHTAGNRQLVKGQWTQTVWEVDDAPRYQGTSKWISVNGKYYWENTTDAPLPRREYTKRSDYNVMQRTNKVIITDTGWVHEQDNKKIIRKDGAADTWVADEKGFNIYTKTDDSRCSQAAAWWAKNKQFWNTVRQSWEETLKEKENLQLIPKVEGKLLYQQLGMLKEQGLAGEALKEKIKLTLRLYVK